jgi:hypothetical protein
VTAETEQKEEREQDTDTLFGFPIIWTEESPLKTSVIVLTDWWSWLKFKYTEGLSPETKAELDGLS